MVGNLHIAGATQIVRAAFLMAGAALIAVPAVAASDPRTGRDLAVELCSGCHLVGPEQKGPVTDGVPAFEMLAKDPAITDDRLRNFIVDPHPPMPKVQLTATEMDAIVAYIRSLSSR